MPKKSHTQNSNHSTKSTTTQPLLGARKRSIYLRLLQTIRPYWFSLVIGIIGTMLATGTDALFTWAVKPFIDQGLVARDQWLIQWLPIIIISAVVVRGITYFLSNYYITRIGRSVVMDFRCKLFNHLMHMPASFYDRESSGKILSLVIYNTEQVALATTEALLIILQEGFTVVALLTVMLVVSWKLTLLFLITAPIVSVVVSYTTKRLRRLSGNVQKTMGELSQVAEEGVEGYRVVRIFGGEEYEKQKFNNFALLNRHREMKVVVTNSIGTSIVQIIAALPIVVIIYIAMLPSMHISAGAFGAIVATMVRILTPIRRLTKVNTEIQKGLAGAQSIFELLDSELEKDLGHKHLARAQGHIAYKNVHFHYPHAHKEVLHDINITIEPGQTVALVGRSGGGKTTLVSLLPRFYDVTHGSIEIDGLDVHQYKLADLRKQFAFVSQNLTLFNDTIARNIAYGNLERTSEKKIIQAAEAAYIMDFIKQLPDGLNSVIGENGLLLSGGQRQRIAIARALLKNAPILILDEATSALDTESEFYIQQALEKLMRHRTTIVIAHRLSTVERADKIIVVEKGKIIESGNHQELLAHNGQYASLYNMQFPND
jgi:ATP-binding cassette, subfamily B, bacterial MsbA